MGWATFWATFLQNHLVTLIWSQSYDFCNAEDNASLESVFGSRINYFLFSKPIVAARASLLFRFVKF
jgi:hypothetical protein